jgi:lysophospholipase L1-like esterase
MINRRRFIAGAGVLPFVGSDAVAQVARPGMRRRYGNPDGYLNFGLSYLPIWARKLDGVKAGTGRARVLCLGDSTTNGTGGGPDPSNNHINCDPFAYPSRIAVYCTSRGVKAVQNSFVAHAAGGADADSRIPENGDWQRLATASFGSAMMHNNADTEILPFTPLLAFDNFTLCHVRFGGYGIFDYNIDGGAGFGPVNADGGTALRTLSHAVARGTHTINVAKTVADTTQVRMVWFEVWDSTIPSVQFFNAGGSGGTVSDLVTNANVLQGVGCITTFAPDLTIIVIGINDITAGTTESSFKTSLQTAINTARLSGDVILCSPTPTTQSAVAQQVFSGYTRDLANLNGCSFVDLNYLMGPNSRADTLGWKANGNHPSAAGYDVGAMAGYIGRAVLGE